MSLNIFNKLLSILKVNDYFSDLPGWWPVLILYFLVSNNDLLNFITSFADFLLKDDWKKYPWRNSKSAGLQLQRKWLRTDDRVLMFILYFLVSNHELLNFITSFADFLLKDD